jgi:hypothetical protein
MLPLDDIIRRNNDPKRHKLVPFDLQLKRRHRWWPTFRRTTR